jgi:hypothetical protein
LIGAKRKARQGSGPEESRKPCPVSEIDNRQVEAPKQTLNGPRGAHAAPTHSPASDESLPCARTSLFCCLTWQHPRS